MTTRLSNHLVTLLALLNVLCSQGSGLPALGTYSNLRLGNTASLDGQNEDDPSELRMKQDSDIYPGGLNANDKLYYQLLQGVPRAARHADGLFTSGYSKLLGQQSARKYLESLMGKRVSTLDEQEPVKRHSDALFTDRYSRIRKQMALKKYLNGLVAGKRSQELSPADLPDTAQYDENFENLAVDDLLNRLPSLSR